MPTVTNLGPVPFTEDDLNAARYADLIDDENRVQYDGQKTARDVIFALESELFGEVWGEDTHGEEIVHDWGNPEHVQRFDREIVELAWVTYQRGKVVLESCKVVSSDRTTVMPSRRLQEQIANNETIVSPVCTILAGYIATTQAYRYVALALRKQ